MTGGIADKLGNIYEAKGAVHGLLEVLQGDALAVRYESIDPQEHGIDWFLRYVDTEKAIQAKTGPTNGKWSIRALEREGVLKSAEEWLNGYPRRTFMFLSESPSPEIERLCEKAKRVTESNALLLTLSRPQRDDFEHLCEIWNVSSETALDFVKRCEFEARVEHQLDELIQLRGQIVFANPTMSIFPILRDYIEERMGLELAADKATMEIVHGGRLSFRPRHDPALWDRLRAANRLFIESHPIFGARTPIHREEADRITKALFDNVSPRLFLVTGSAGSGKSFILKEIISELERKAVPHLSLRVDKYLSALSLGELGRHILGREENPLLTLVEYAGNNLCVLILDQVDAIGEASGRNSSMRELVLRLIDVARTFESVRVIAACRSYDLSSDPRLKSLANDEMVLNVQASPLDWTRDVEPQLQVQGFDTHRIQPALRAILSSPLNLAIFLELGADSNLDSIDQLTDLSTLYDRLVLAKAKRLADVDLVETLAVIARKMSEDQALDAPDSVLEPKMIDPLASEQLIVRSRSRISFFHETFFDYVYSRDFVGKAKSIVEFLKADEQILFRRTQVRQILNYYRQTEGRDGAKYLSELRSVLNDGDVRYHIKDAVAGWLGSLPNPCERELDIVLGLDTADFGMPFLVRKAVYAQPSWASILAQRNLLSRWLRSPVENRRNDAMALLTTLLKADQSAAVECIESYWREAPAARLPSVLRWLLFANDIEPSESLIGFMCSIASIDTGESEGARSIDHLIPYAWYTGHPEAVGRILSAFFSAWFSAHPDDHPYSQNGPGIVPDHVLQALRKGSLEICLHTLLPVFLETIERIGRANYRGMTDFTFFSINEGFNFGSDVLLQILRECLVETVKQAPEKAAGYLDTIGSCLHPSCIYLHLSAIAAGGKELANRLASLLDIPGLMEAGPSGATWLPFAQAVQAVIAILSPEIRERIEAMILGYWPELDHAFSIARQLKAGEKGFFTSQEVAYSFLHDSGRSQWAIIKTIGEENFSPSARIRFAMLDRKFPGAAIPEPNTITGGFVPPPILPDRAKHMSDVQWIRAVENYPGDGIPPIRRGRGLINMHSGAGGLSQVLREQTKADPERFARLFMQLPQDANPEYGDAILHGLVESKVDSAALLPLIGRLNRERNPGFCSGFCWLISARPALSAINDAFELLLWYMENGPISTSGEAETQRIQQDMLNADRLLDGMGGIMMLHGDRAAAARALASVIAHCAERRDAAVGQLRMCAVKEQARSIRCALSEPILYAFEVLSDKSVAFAILKALIERDDGFDPYPLSNYHGIFLLHRALHFFPLECENIIERLVQSPDERIVQIGAYFSFYQAFISLSYQDTSIALLSAKSQYRYIDAGLAAQFVAEDQFRELSTRKLIEYFNDPDERARKSALKCFRYLTGRPLGSHEELLDAYIHSAAFVHADHFFFEFVKSAPDSSRDVVITIGERMLDLARQGINGDFGFEAGAINDMLNREYSETANAPSSRIRILNLIDDMLQAGIYGATQIVEQHERR
jgi:hypothetical protein